jgi:hypothetical protein
MWRALTTSTQYVQFSIFLASTVLTWEWPGLDAGTWFIVRAFLAAAIRAIISPDIVAGVSVEGRRPRINFISTQAPDPTDPVIKLEDAVDQNDRA